MALLSKSGIATIAVATGLVLTAGTSGAVAGAMITGKQIKNNSVTTKDIKNNNLTGGDIADGSISAADLAAADRAAATDRGVAGLVTKAGVLTVFTAPSGATVTATHGANDGQYCIRVAGGTRTITPATSALVASPNYRDDTTQFTAKNASVESSGSMNDPICPGGFAVVTYERNAGGITQADEGFLFQIN
jgi:hypothetical protein